MPATTVGQRQFTVVVERCLEPGGFYGYVPGWSGAHAEGETLEELKSNLQEVLAMLLEDGEPALDSEYYGTETIRVP